MKQLLGKWTYIIFLSGVFIFSFNCRADEIALEIRAMDITKKLRCTVCQNQTLFDSHSAVAVSVKQEIYKQLADGYSDQDIYDFLQQRFGDYIFFQPRVNSLTIFLWIIPFSLFGLALFFWYKFIR